MAEHARNSALSRTCQRVIIAVKKARRMMTIM